MILRNLPSENQIERLLAIAIPPTEVVVDPCVSVILIGPEDLFDDEANGNPDSLVGDDEADDEFDEMADFPDEYDSDDDEDDE